MAIGCTLDNFTRLLYQKLGMLILAIIFATLTCQKFITLTKECNGKFYISQYQKRCVLNCSRAGQGSFCGNLERSFLAFLHILMDAPVCPKLPEANAFPIFKTATRN